MIQTPAQFIEAVGPESIARATGRTTGAIAVWKSRNRLPREAWLELSLTFSSLTLEELRRLERNGVEAAKSKSCAA